MKIKRGRPTKEFARFYALTKRVISVPKAEIDRREAAHRAPRPAEKSEKKAN